LGLANRSSQARNLVYFAESSSASDPLDADTSFSIICVLGPALSEELTIQGVYSGLTEDRSYSWKMAGHNDRKLGLIVRVDALQSFRPSSLLADSGNVDRRVTATLWARIRIRTGSLMARDNVAHAVWNGTMALGDNLPVRMSLRSPITLDARSTRCGFLITATLAGKEAIHVLTYGASHNGATDATEELVSGAITLHAPLAAGWDRAAVPSHSGRPSSAY